MTVRCSLLGALFSLFSILLKKENALTFLPHLPPLTLVKGGGEMVSELEAILASARSSATNVADQLTLGKTVATKAFDFGKSGECTDEDELIEEILREAMVEVWHWVTFCGAFDLCEI